MQWMNIYDDMMLPVVDLLLAVLMITAFRYIFGLLSGVDTTRELAKKDNYAFGISFAGAAMALAFIIASAVAGEPADSLFREIENIVLYAVLGMILLKFGMWINDRAIFNQISMKDEIDRKNITIGMVQAANFLALGFVISAAIDWVETENMDGLLSVVLMFFSAQVVLFLTTRIRSFIYAKRHGGEQLQLALRDGNPALAIRYAGHLVGVAIASAGVSILIPYQADQIAISAVNWLLASVVMTLLVTGITIVARQFILFRINVVEEVDEQKNIGVASIEAVIYISVASILYPIFNIILMLD